MGNYSFQGSDLQMTQEQMAALHLLTTGARALNTILQAGP